MSEPSFPKPPSAVSGSAAEERREVTAVAIPGRFLPPAAEAPVGRDSLATAEPSREIVAAVRRLVASTDDAALGLTGFRWDLDDELVAPQPAAVTTAVTTAVTMEEATPLPQPVLPPADFFADLATADLSDWEPSPGAPDAAELGPIPLPAASTHAARTIRDAILVPGEAAALPSEEALMPSAVVPAARDPAAPLGEAAWISSAAFPVASEATPLTGEAPPLPEAAGAPSEAVAAEEVQLPRAAAPMPSAGESPPVSPTAFPLHATPPPDQYVPGPDELAWAPVGFLPEMVTSPTPSGASGAAAARSAASPISAATPARQVPATSAAPLRKETPTATKPRPIGNLPAVVWGRRRRLGQLVRRAPPRLWSLAQALAGAGLARLRTGPPRLLTLWGKVRRAASPRELRLTWPVDRRTAIPWIAAGGAVLILIAILLTAHSYSARAKLQRARPPGAAVAPPPEPLPETPAADDEPPQDGR